jgi:hypothetical protein
MASAQNARDFVPGVTGSGNPNDATENSDLGIEPNWRLVMSIFE